jgi:hypothetical protein
MTLTGRARSSRKNTHRHVADHRAVPRRWWDARRAAAAAFRVDRDRRDFVAAHTLVRVCAGLLLDLPAGDFTGLSAWQHDGVMVGQALCRRVIAAFGLVFHGR